jgi:amino-acid N-acetyltransferase
MLRKPMRTRKAILPDAEHIHDLICAYSGDGTLLPRTLAEICENVRDFVVLEDVLEDATENGSRIIGCGALHLYGTHLAEIRSITVAPWAQGRGGGGRLVKALLAEAKRHRVDCICLFTRKPDFFGAQGFSVVQREDIPDKIYKDCHACPRYHCCDEVAMVRGDLPKFAILPEPANWLVKLQAWTPDAQSPSGSS